MQEGQDGNPSRIGLYLVQVCYKLKKDGVHECRNVHEQCRHKEVQKKHSHLLVRLRPLLLC